MGSNRPDSNFSRPSKSVIVATVQHKMSSVMAENAYGQTEDASRQE